ncbi:cysteine-rich rlk receptor-like protein kinase 8 protein [Lasius niger]|uniref:Cysteine-rich rlk receptor-like protein kinase 8 protein n=1 Tax=Lasius niger TaxID=67767 RepID=A0A0J7KK14_LASNI|nr:cysteine-rich rlk receptor-like protein kinase 8 protein [Lasius niger]
MVSGNDSWMSINELKGAKNYHMWSMAVRALLELSGLEDCIVTGEGAVVDISKQKKAKGRLLLSIDESLYVHVENAIDAAQMWNILEKMFKSTGATHKIGLIQKLINVRLENCESMADYLSQITSVVNRLSGVDFKIGDELTGAIMLAGLTEEFKPMVMEFKGSGIKTTADAIKLKLLDSDYNTGQATAFIGKNVSKLNTEHKAKDFKKSKVKSDKLEKSDKSESSSTEKGTKGGTNRAFYAFSVTSFSEETQPARIREWYIDSGASRHMTPHKTLIGNLESTALTKISTANNYKIDVSEIGDPIDGVYRFRVDDAKCLLTTSGNGDNAMTWHRCLGHINYNDLCKMRNGLVDGIKFTNADEDIKQCEACMKAKQTRLPFQPSDKRAGNTLDIIHSDLCGPMETPSIGKARFGIQHQHSVPYTPEQNGVAERANRTIVERAKCMLFDAGLEKPYWAEAVNMAVYIINRSASSVLNNQTPEEVWTGKKVDVSNVLREVSTDDNSSKGTVEEDNDDQDCSFHSKRAMSDEMDSLAENKTWELVRLPLNRKAIKSKWVFKTKRDANGTVLRHKARLVAKGCSQKYGIDYNETYSPVIRYTFIRFLMALAVKHGLKVDQMDAVTAFLQGNLATGGRMQTGYRASRSAEPANDRAGDHRRREPADRDADDGGGRGTTCTRPATERSQMGLSLTSPFLDALVMPIRGQECTPKWVSVWHAHTGPIMYCQMGLSLASPCLDALVMPIRGQ